MSLMERKDSRMVIWEASKGSIGDVGKYQMNPTGNVFSINLCTSFRIDILGNWYVYNVTFFCILACQNSLLLENWISKCSFGALLWNFVSTVVVKGRSIFRYLYNTQFRTNNLFITIYQTWRWALLQLLINETIDSKPRSSERAIHQTSNTWW